MSGIWRRRVAVRSDWLTLLLPDRDDQIHFLTAIEGDEGFWEVQVRIAFRQGKRKWRRLQEIAAQVGVRADMTREWDEGEAAESLWMSG